MYKIILGFGALAINECQGQCPFSMCVEVSDWVQMSPADQCMQICVFQKHHGPTADCFRLNVFSTTVTAQHTITAKMSNTQYSLQVHE